jgi:hypothetical protein
MFRRGSFFLVLILLALPGLAGITTKPVGADLSADDVAQLLTGPGATISNVRITGGANAIGSFTEGQALGLVSGVILSTGNIAGAAGPNNAPDAGENVGQPGHPALDQIVEPFPTFDAVTLEFDVVTVSPTFAIRYVFASEEYREYVGSRFNDVFAFFINGGNIAIAPGTNDPVTVNTINHIQNAGAYRDNENGAFETQFDGFTTVLTAVAIVEPNVSHHIRIAIADASDGIYDSAVLIAQGGISGVPIAPLLVPTTNLILTRNLESTAVPVDVFFTTVDSPTDFSASGLPSDSNVTFSPLFIGPDGQLRTTATVNIGPTTPAGTYEVILRSAASGTESFAHITVVVACQPPSILGIMQPQGQTVTRGARATLNVQPSGSAPFSYQWFEGFTGMTGTPIAGATTPQFQTPAVNAPTPYWVRVSNPCGSTNSNAAFVLPQ